MTRPRLRSLCVLGPFFIFMACSSGGSAGPGGGGAGGSAGHGGTGSGSAGKGGASGSGGTSGVAGTSGGGGSGAAGSGGTGGSAAGSGGAAGAGGSAGGAAGAGGSAGAAGGAAGSGGAAGAAGGAAGSGGAAGAAGSGGGGGTGAAAGASGGAGGAAGAGGSGGAGGATTTNLRVEYLNSSAAATTFSVRITNLGPSTPLISGLRIRYYFHDDTTNPDGGPGRDATPTVTAATWQIASPSTSINLRSTGGCGASAAFTTPATIDLGCYLASPMNVQDMVTIAISVDPTTQLAANDYSYADTAGAFAANDHLTLFWNGVLQSGTPPP